MSTIISIASSKGGVGKTTLAANLGAYVADVSGQNVLLVDLDAQPTLTSYFPLTEQPRAGIFELLAQGQTEGIITPTALPGVDVIASNDPYGQLSTLLVHAPDGRVRLRKLLPKVAASRGYGLIIIDTQGARSVLMESAILAAQEVLSPLPPQTLAAREFVRGTVSLLSELRSAHPGLSMPLLSAVLNLVDHTVDSQTIAAALRTDVIGEFDPTQVRLLATMIPAMTAYREAATARVPAHRYEPRRPAGRKTPSAAEVMAALAAELGLAWGHPPHRREPDAVSDGDSAHTEAGEAV